MTNPVALATTVWGKGPRRALLLHGLTSAATTWWRVGPGLAELGFTVVAPDLRGHGDSPAGDLLSIEAYRDDVLLLNGSWDLLVGHSLGGAIAAAVAEAQPGFARRVLYEDPALDWIRAAEFVTESPALVGVATAHAVAAEHPAWHPDDVKSKVEALRACRPDVEAKTVADIGPRDLWSVVLGAEVSSLVIAADPAVGSLVTAEQEAEARDHSVPVVRIAGTGHSVHRDAPEEFMALVAEFATSEARGSSPVAG